MKIAVLSNAAVGHTRRWVEHFRARGHRAEVWSLEAPLPGFDAHALPAPPLPGFLRYPLAVPAAARAMRDFAPDLLDAHYVPNYGLIGALLGQAGLRVPLSVSAWGSDLLLAAGRNVLQRARARFVLARADAVIADAANLAAAARALGAAPSRTFTCPWGVDRVRFAPAAVRTPGLWLSTRMHETVYDLSTVLRGAAGAMRLRPDAFLAVVGDGTLRARHERLAADLMPAGRYAFLGRLEPAALAEWLGRAEVSISASHSDSTSLSLLEAMSAGAIPVVSDIPGNREWVRDGEGARMFAAGDADALARALVAAGDVGWAAAARAHNARVVAERGDLHSNMTRIESLFERLARREPLPDPASAPS